MVPFAVLADVVVVEVGQGIAGAVAGRMLAAAGAQVVKAPLRALTRDAPHVVQAIDDLDRDKRVLPVDAAAPDVLAEIAVADVVIEQVWCNGGTAMASALAAIAMRDDAVHCVVRSGLDVDIDHLAIVDAESLIGAASGVFASAISGQALAGVSFIDVPIASVAAGQHIALSCAIALAHEPRRRRIDIALTDVPSFHKGVEFSRSDHLATVQATQMAASGMYRCADGAWVQLDAPSTRMTTRLHGALRSMGVDDTDLDVLRTPLVDVDRAAGARLRARLTEVFATRPADVWERSLSDADVPCARCRAPHEWLTSDLAVAGGAVRIVDGADGPRRVAGEVWR